MFTDDDHYYVHGDDEEHPEVPGTIDYNIEHALQIATTAVQANNEVAAKVAEFANEDASQKESEGQVIEAKKAKKTKENKAAKKAKRALEKEQEKETAEVKEGNAD